MLIHLLLIGSLLRTNELFSLKRIGTLFFVQNPTRAPCRWLTPLVESELCDFVFCLASGLSRRLCLLSCLQDALEILDDLLGLFRLRQCLIGYTTQLAGQLASLAQSFL